MAALSRSSILISAALAVATPALAGRAVWHYLDESQARGLGYVLLYWPSLLLGLMPPAFTEGFTRSAIWMVLLYFVGYLMVCGLAQRAWAAIPRRKVAPVGHKP